MAPVAALDGLDDATVQFLLAQVLQARNCGGGGGGGEGGVAQGEGGPEEGEETEEEAVDEADSAQLFMTSYNSSSVRCLGVA